jgi:methylated-DNA-[protein]-cysteine S-methyltransferase
LAGGVSGNGVVSFHCLRDSRFGRFAVVWTRVGGRPRVTRVVLSTKRVGADRLVAALFPTSQPGACAEIKAVADDIAAFLRGKDVRFSLSIARLEGCSKFQQRVLRAEHAIPRGEVSTYGLIARHLGNPSAARAVGRALATNPFPIIIPCHRAVRSGGTMGGYQGGPAMKRALLEAEGVGFDHAGRVVAARFHYRGRRESVEMRGALVVSSSDE